MGNRGVRLDPIGRYFDSEISAPRNTLSARIVMVCLLPVVRSDRLALKPAVLTTIWKLPPPPRPCRTPEMLRLVSVQVPVTCPPWSTMLAPRLILAIWANTNLRVSILSTKLMSLTVISWLLSLLLA